MNRPLFIIIGSVIILVLILVWVYVLFIRDNFTDSNNTGNSGTFSNLDLEDTSLGENPDDSNSQDSTSSSTLDTAEQKKLRQLTTKYVVGFSELNASTSDVVYFIEAGVGHIYEVDIFTGQERRISATTYPDTYTGDISADGQYFVLQTGYTSNRETHTGMIDVDALAATETRQLEKGIVSFTLLKQNKLLYAVPSSNDLTVKVYDMKAKTTRNLFTVPFLEADIVWGNNEAGPHYFFPKPALGLEGFLYEYKDTVTRRLPLEGFNFSAYGGTEMSLGTFEYMAKYQTELLSNTNNSVLTLAQPVLPYKCLETRDSSLVCGVDTTQNLSTDSLQSWHQGTTRFADDFYNVDIATGETTEVANTFAITGRTVDATHLEQGTKNHYIYFINKNDQSLWVYEHEPALVESNLQDDNE